MVALIVPTLEAGSAPSNTGYITGVVLTEAGAPLRGVLVTASNTHEKAVSKTSPQGFYALEVLAGMYNLEAHMNGFETASHPEAAVMPGQVLMNVNFTLALGGIVSGMVYESEGLTSVPYVTVTATREGVTFDTLSYRDGSYRLIGLPAGRYELTAVGPPGYAAWTVQDVQVTLRQEIKEVDVLLVKPAVFDQ